MAKLTLLELPDAQHLGARFGLDVVSIEAMDAGSVNSNFSLVCADGRRCFARIFEEQTETGARAERLLLQELAALGVPTAVPLSPVTGDELCLHSGKPLSFYPWIEGVHLCNALVTPERTLRLGSTLAQVHLASSALSQIPEGRFSVEGMRRRLASVRQETRRFDPAVSHISERLDHYTRLRDTALPSGLIHGDLFRDNVVWQGAEIAALLDFESACFGPFIYDLCVCALSWCYTDQFCEDKLQALFRGYEAVRPLGSDERKALRAEGAIACLRFASTRLTDFSLRCPPGAKPGREFIRFLERLEAIESGAFDSL